MVARTIKQSLMVALLSAGPAFAQSTVLLKCNDGTTSFWCADSANNAIRVNVVASAAGGTSSSFGAAFPATGTASGFSDGTNMQGGRVFDADTGAGTQYVVGAYLRKAASGGSVDFGTSTDPIRTDPTGTTTQPVNVFQINGVTPLMGNGITGTGSLRVTIASDNTAFGVNLAQYTPVSGRLPVDPSGVTSPVSITAGNFPDNEPFNLAQVAGVVPSATNGLAVRETDGTGFISSDVIGALRYKKVSMVQDIEASAGNSSTTNLGAGLTFTGTSQTTLGVGSIQVNLFADQNCTIQVQQAQEDPGVNWNIIDSWTYTASSTGADAARTIQATASSVRVLVTNNGGAGTTVFRLQTVVCPVCDSLPRGLTQLGNLKVAINESIVPGTAATNLGKAEDAVAASGDTGIAVLGVRRDTLTTSPTSASGDYSEMAVDPFGAVWTRNRQIATYSAGTTAKTASAAGTGPFFTLCGSATKTLRVQRFNASFTVATTAVYGDVVLKKTSTATSAGTATALTKAPHDSSSAASTANACNFYTVLATAGTSVGVVYAFPMVNSAVTATVGTTLTPPGEAGWTARTESEAIVLRGTAQCLEANFGTTTTNAPTLTLSVTWTEE